MVLTRNEAHIVSIPEKKIVQKIGGVNGDFGIQKLQNDLLISDGRTAQLISHEDGKVLARTTLPPDTVVVAGLSTGSTEKPTKGLIVGSELEGMVSTNRFRFGQGEGKSHLATQDASKNREADYCRRDRTRCRGLLGWSRECVRPGRDTQDESNFSSGCG